MFEQLDEAVSRILADPAGPAPSVDASLEELLTLARELRELPNPGFKERLKQELERKATMSTTETVVRPGFRTVTPYLLSPNADFADFMMKVFGAIDMGRHPTPSGFHGEFKIGDSMVMLGAGAPRSMPAVLQVYLPNADEVYQRSLDAGAVSEFSVTEGYGDRFGCVRDAIGNKWIISTHLGPHYIPENLPSIVPYYHPSAADAPRFIDFLKRAFGASEYQRYDDPDGKVLHAKIRIGDSIIAVGQPGPGPMSSMVLLYVPDTDGLFEQALRAGAKSLSAPSDQSYGRTAGVSDEWGNQWYMATP